MKPEELQEKCMDRIKVVAYWTLNFSRETPEEVVQPEENWPKKHDESFKTLREGDIVKGKVMSVGKNGALVDVGYSLEGIISAPRTRPSGNQVFRFVSRRWM